jgi:hypothetical protein
MEATGTYWMRLAYTLHEAGFVVSVVNPVQAHRLAQAQLRRAKTDAIDARLLMELGFKLEPTPWTPPPPLYDALYQRLRQRDAFLEMRTQERNRLHALRQWPDAQRAVVERYQAHLAFLTEQIDASPGRNRTTLALGLGMGGDHLLSAQYQGHWPDHCRLAVRRHLEFHHLPNRRAIGRLCWIGSLCAPIRHQPQPNAGRWTWGPCPFALSPLYGRHRLGAV